jgi:hypothetical protein
MDQDHVAIRRHAIFKHQYRRVVANAADFHRMPLAAQWTLLRAQVVAESSGGQSPLVEMLDSRESRRDEVLAKLEDGRQQDSKNAAGRRDRRK